jgi:hypothetical protein
METIEKQQSIVKEIHAAVDSAADRLVTKANEFLIGYTKQQSYYYAFIEEINRKIESIRFKDEKRLEQLKSLGFTGVPEIKKLERIKACIQGEKETLIKKKEAIGKEIKKREQEQEEIKKEHDFALYYKKEYPFLKFLREEQLDGICKKYNLVYAPVSNYIGDIPQKNLDEISRFHTVKKEDMVEQTYYARIGDKIVKYNEEIEIINANIRQNNFPTPLIEIYEDKRDGLFIAANKSLFKDLESLDNKGFGFFMKPEKVEFVNPDPIVFCYVKGGVLIISKWGDEANDPELVIPKLN